jgi:hypothetical protein
VLDAGDLLVVAGDDDVALEAADTEITVETGAARVSRDLGVDIGLYAGTATVDSASAVRAVPGLRQLNVPVLGRPARDLRPIRYDAADPWDRRFLGDAIALGEELQGLADTYSASLEPGAGRTVGFYRQVLPGLDGERGFDQGLLDPPRPPGEVLVGAAIADLADRGSFADRWDAVFGFRDDGAAWGLVALDQGVGRGPLLRTVEHALEATTFEFTAPAAEPAPPGSSPTTPTGDPASPTTPSGSTPTTSPPGTTAPSTPTTLLPPPPTTPTLPPILPPPDDEGLLDPVLDGVDPVTEVLEDLLGGILGGGG